MPAFDKQAKKRTLFTQARADNKSLVRLFTWEAHYPIASALWSMEPPSYRRRRPEGKAKPSWGSTLGVPVSSTAVDFPPGPRALHPKGVSCGAHFLRSLSPGWRFHKFVGRINKLFSGCSTSPELQDALWGLQPV